jgi:membrane fusion protein (multidrug efflux system)
MTTPENAPPLPDRRRLPLAIAVGAACVVALGIALVARAGARVNKVPLTAAAQGVTVVEARAAQYRPSRRYVGTIQPWVEAKVGPQIIAGYVDTVLVRPGDLVRRGQVLATLDCRNASAASRAISMQARALQTEQEALAHEAARVTELKAGGFASANEIERHDAESASKRAELMQTQANVQRASLEVNDCVLRAPFAGEIAARLVDPGAFVRPGTSVATLVDRTSVRVTAEVPEGDFAVVAVGTPVQIDALATKQRLRANIARRSPAADAATRTVHFEIDVPDPARALPVGTTAELEIDVGAPAAVTEVPLIAASVRGAQATLFVVDGQTAHKAVYAVAGERGRSLFLERALAAGSRVVTEGRALLKDGDRVAATLDREASSPPPAASGPAHASASSADGAAPPSARGAAP